MENETFKYYAFISYSHRDMKVARKLQRRLERYHLPATLVKKNPGLPKKLSPIFRDETDIVGIGSLKKTLYENLDNSNYLILICSPSSAKSEYVNDEVKHFIEIGRVDHIIPLIIDGVPHSGDETECFPPAILELPREDEILGISLKTFGVREAFVRVIATLLRLDIGAFVSRYRRELIRNAILIASALVALVVAAIMLMPPPYNEDYAETIMSYAVCTYTEVGAQYENLDALAECAVNNPENFSYQLKLYKIGREGMKFRNSLIYLSDMMKTGKVMPWSGKPMNHVECAELLTLADKRRDEYKYFASVLEFVMTDEYAKRFYSSQYLELLRGLLEVDAKIAAEFYQIVCAPHVTGKYADGSISAKELALNLALVPKQNRHFTGEDVAHSRQSLASLKGEREQYLNKLKSCGAFEAYQIKHGPWKIQPESADVKPVTETVSNDKPDVRVMNDMLGYIYHCEAIQSDILWVLDYFENFDRERSWESLLMARAAVAIAKRDIEKRELQPLQMTAGDQNEFMKRGVDLITLENANMLFNSEKDSQIGTCSVLEGNITSYVFLKEDWDYVLRHMACLRKLADCMIQDLADTADLVLTSINDPATTEKFNALLAEHCPRTRAHQRKKPDTVKNIEAQMHENVNKYREAAMELGEVSGVSRNRVNLVKYGLEKKDTKLISTQPLEISNMPPMIHLPKWSVNENDTNYFWKDSDGKPRILPPCSKLERVPDLCMITYNDVSLTQVKEYQKELEGEGIQCLGSKEENKKFYLLYELDGGSFNIVWEDNRVNILMRKDPVCFIPYLYLVMRKGL